MSGKNVHKAPIEAGKALKIAIRKKAHWSSKERREAYMEEAVDQGISWQIKLNRTARGLSQKDLAALCETQQSAISRLEDPLQGNHSLEMLTRVAKALDCALMVKLISYSALALESQRLSEVDQYAAPFSAEQGLFLAR